MGEIWIPEAERLGDGAIGGLMDSPSAPGRAVWHTTESSHGNASFKNVAAYLIKIGREPHILYDPTTDRIGQFGPMNQSARALKNDGATRTNRTGRVCIQIEVLARASKPFTGYWKPGPNFRALMRAIRSWGVPDTWPAGALATSYGARVSRSRTTWAGRGGHYGHCNVPGNDHWDPGGISQSAIFSAAPVTSTPPAKPPTSKPPTRPTVDLSRLIDAARRDPAKAGTPVSYAGVKVVEQALVKAGLLKSSLADGHYGTATKDAYAAWQRSLGYSGRDADGIPGATSLKKLGTKYGFTVIA